MASTIHPYLTQPDIIVLQNLFNDVDNAEGNVESNE
jgi:hypothetical protein